MHTLALLLLLTVNVDGVVKYEDVPVPGVIVTVTDANGVAHTTVTDIDGRYRVANVASPYLITAAIPGFRANPVGKSNFELTPLVSTASAANDEPQRREDGPHYTYARRGNRPLPVPVELLHLVPGVTGGPVQ
jgi:Carboxypeptidase regulatory-like domain